MTRLPPDQARLGPVDLDPHVGIRTGDRNSAGVFGPDHLDRLEAFFREFGYATLRDAFDDAELLEAEAELAGLQRGSGRGHPRPAATDR